MSDELRAEDDVVEVRKMKKTEYFHRNTEWWMTSAGNPVTCIQLRKDTMMTGSTDRVIKVWDFAGGASRCSYTLFSHENHLRCLQFDDDKIVSGADDRTIKFWSRSTMRCYKTVGMAEDPVSLSFNSEALAVGGKGGTIFFLDLEGNQTGSLATVDEGTKAGPVWSLKLAGSELLSTSHDLTVKLWDVETRQEKVRLSGHQNVLTCVDRIGDIVASASLDRTVRIWDLRKGEGDRCVCKLDQFEGPVGSVVLRDANTVFTGAADGFVRVFDIPSGDVIKDWLEDNQVNCISVDGCRVAVGTRSNITVLETKFTTKKKK